MWHKVAPDLARHCTLVIPDLRGYGGSSAPLGDEEHLTYSKRAMAEDGLIVMRELGHPRFMVAGHDRGGRVAYRLALDHPEAVTALVPVDIIPTAEVWRRTTAESALRGYHWQFLAQPFPLPETLIGKDPVYYLEHTLKSWTGSRDLTPFSPGAMAHYRAQVQDPARVHAFCEDYRAGAGIDRTLDEADFAAGRKIACPTLVLHSSSYLKGSPLEVWRAWCTNVGAAAVTSGHFLAEENPADTLAALVPFIEANSRAS
jgi:haloacetate dehalogenase